MSAPCAVDPARKHALHIALNSSWLAKWRPLQSSTQPGMPADASCLVVTVYTQVLKHSKGSSTEILQQAHQQARGLRTESSHPSRL